MNAGWRFRNDDGIGLAGSVLLHGLALLGVLLLSRVATIQQQHDLHPVLVDIIRLGQETTSPPATQKSQTPAREASARRAPKTHSPPEAVRPRAPKPSDDLDNRLDALAKLKAPETNTETLTGPGDLRVESESSEAAAGSDAAYALRDYVRAQVLRRWSLDLSLLGKRNWIVALRVAMKPSGQITKAEIVDAHRFATDAVFRQIAMSARNAVLLASPILLPAGSYPDETEMTLNLNPRDALH